MNSQMVMGSVLCAAIDIGNCCLDFVDAFDMVMDLH